MHHLLTGLREARPSLPGMFITATDTGVGKTIVSAGIARLLREQGLRVAVSKPLISDCRREQGVLVGADTVRLARAAGYQGDLELVSPLRFEPPLAPGPAAALAGSTIDWSALGPSLGELARVSNADAVVVEGVGGLLVPLDATDASLTVLDLIEALGWPVLVVCRPSLGTLNHTAMTCRLLDQAGVARVGLVINGWPDDRAREQDPSIDLNPAWLERMTGWSVLAKAPLIPGAWADDPHADLPETLLEPLRAAKLTDRLALPR